MWQYVACSVVGSDHEKERTAIQDRCHVELIGEEPHPILLACVADGAGSATFGGDGAEIACRIVAASVVQHFQDHGTCGQLQALDVRQWCQSIRREIEAAAEIRQTTARQFATTLCAAIVAPDVAVFFQIGDGAIVLRNHGAFGVVFWPQGGEFANSTNFLTADDYDKHLEFCRIDVSVDEVALLTDGMERMSLLFETRIPFAPFFRPIFDALRGSADVRGLNEEMRRFLSSDPVCSRSYDDKSLIIAARKP